MSFPLFQPPPSPNSFLLLQSRRPPQIFFLSLRDANKFGPLCNLILLFFFSLSCVYSRKLKKSDKDYKVISAIAMEYHGSRGEKVTQRKREEKSLRERKKITNEWANVMRPSLTVPPSQLASAIDPVKVIPISTHQKV